LHTPPTNAPQKGLVLTGVLDPVRQAVRAGLPETGKTEYARKPRVEYVGVLFRPRRTLDPADYAKSTVGDCGG